jgi:hypothetical protein
MFITSSYPRQGFKYRPITILNYIVYLQVIGKDLDLFNPILLNKSSNYSMILKASIDDNSTKDSIVVNNFFL